MANFKPRYTNASEVKLYLRRKAEFGLSSSNTIDNLTTQQCNSFITKAESRVHRDLSLQYIIPFIGSNGESFSELPQDTQIFIQEMSTWKTICLIMTTYYSNSEGDRGAAFLEHAEREYQELKAQVTEMKNGRYLTTPLLGLAVNKNASYRTDAGVMAPKTVSIGSGAIDDSNITRDKLTDLNRRLYYGWITPRPTKFNS